MELCKVGDVYTPLVHSVTLTINYVIIYAQLVCLIVLLTVVE